jgi:hypothetical protein
MAAAVGTLLLIGAAIDSLHAIETICNASSLCEWPRPD